MDFYIYILYSEKANKYYIGHTSDVNRRLFEHNNPEKSTKFTAKYLPWTLVTGFLVSQYRGQAIAVERFIKKQKSRNFILKIIQNSSNRIFIDEIIDLANKKNH